MLVLRHISTLQGFEVSGRLWLELSGCFYIIPGWLLHVVKCSETFVYERVNCQAKVIICLLDTSKLCSIMRYLQYGIYNMCTVVYDDRHLLLSPQNKEVGS